NVVALEAETGSPRISGVLVVPPAARTRYNTPVEKVARVEVERRPRRGARIALVPDDVGGNLHDPLAPRFARIGTEELEGGFKPVFRAAPLECRGITEAFLVEFLAAHDGTTRKNNVLHRRFAAARIDNIAGRIKHAIREVRNLKAVCPRLYLRVDEAAEDAELSRIRLPAPAAERGTGG